MLVLARKENESVVGTMSDGRRVKVTVVCIRSDKVRIGIEADRDIVWHREEVQEAIDRGVVNGETVV